MKIALASCNKDKVAEIQHLFKNTGIHLTAQSELGVPEIEETGATFFENALLKARHVANKANLPALGDDSGLVIPALNDAPGVYSSRYAGPNASNEARIEKVLQELDKVEAPNRRAFFHCVLVLMFRGTDPAPIICHGVWEGEILREPKGGKGFGYDPIFYVPTHGCSAAQLDMQVKNQISHRAIAFQQLLKVLKKDYRFKDSTGICSKNTP